jgi:hypothetical protein
VLKVQKYFSTYRARVYSEDSKIVLLDENVLMSKIPEPTAFLMSYEEKARRNECPHLIKTSLQQKRGTPILSAATSTASSDRLILSLPCRSNSSGLFSYLQTPVTSTRTVTSQFEIDDERSIVLTPCRILRLSITPPTFSLMYLPI